LQKGINPFRTPAKYKKFTGFSSKVYPGNMLKSGIFYAYLKGGVVCLYGFKGGLFMNIKRNKGYTFTEILIAAVVAIIVFTAIFAGFQFCRKVATHNRNQIAALNLIQKKIEEIRADIKANRFTNLSTFNGQTTVSTISDGVDTGSTADNLSGTLTVAIIARDRDENSVALTASNIIYAEVTVSMAWSYLGAPFTESLTINTIVTL